MAGTYATSCPMCGGPMSMSGQGSGFGYPPGHSAGFGPSFSFPTPYSGAWAGAYGPGYNPMMAWTGPGFPTDEQISEMIYDAFDADPAIPWDADINVDVTGGVVTLTGTVPSKRIKHDVGDDAWWVPGVWDVSNNLEITPRARRVQRAATPTSS